MSGTNDKVSSMGEWVSANTSTGTLISNFLEDDTNSKSFSEYLAENGNGTLPAESERPKMVANVKVEGGETCPDLLNYQQRGPNSVRANKPSPHGGLSERMAASGFSVPNLDTCRVESTPDVILSPTSLLESPVFLANSMAPLSPTTGKYTYDQNEENMFNQSDEGGDLLLEDIPEAFAFKLPLGSRSLPVANFERMGIPGTKQQLSASDARFFVQSGKPAETANVEDELANFYNQHKGYLQVKGSTEDIMLNQKLSDSLLGSENSPTNDDQQDNEADLKLDTSSAALGTPAEDGYNWRKYGQKQVKGSEYPRSYYKCTQPNCQVKKKVERSHEGHITEIIYKGAHNHAKPPPTRRSGVPNSYPFSDTLADGQEQPNSQLGYSRPFWSSTQNTGGQGSLGDGLEVTSSAFVASESCDPSTSVQQNQDGPRISADAIDGSSILSNDDDEDDQATHGSLSLGCDGDGDETESKRRKFEASAMEISAASRAVREPRIVVQTTSEVDILDDGYRWRKYGQKVVKGNPNPRSYYKCTNPGCTVRKHVERASHDLKSVITTYEGKHNHEVPAARNSGHANAAPSNSTLPSTIPPHGLMRRPEPPQDSLVRFAAHAPLPSFGLPGREQLGPATNFSFSMGQPGLTNLAVAGMRPLSSPIKMPILPSFHSYMVHRHPVEQGLVVPKGEPKEEAVPNPGLPLPNGSSAYHPMMGRLPLGHQL